MVFIGYSPTGRGPSILMQFIKAQRFHLGACGNGFKCRYNGTYLHVDTIHMCTIPMFCFFHIFWRSWLSLCLVSLNYETYSSPQFYSSANIWLIDIICYQWNLVEKPLLCLTCLNVYFRKVEYSHVWRCLWVWWWQLEWWRRIWSARIYSWQCDINWAKFAMFDASLWCLHPYQETT